MFGDIFDYLNCRSCPSFHHTPAKIWGDPDSCYPEESECGDGDFGQEYMCGRIADAIENGIMNGEFSSGEGYLATADVMLDAPQADREALGTDFTTADFWLVFYDERPPVPLKNIEEVYNACFA
jgi:hypothetical protein